MKILRAMPNLTLVIPLLLVSILLVSIRASGDCSTLLTDLRDRDTQVSIRMITALSESHALPPDFFRGIDTLGALVQQLGTNGEHPELRPWARKLEMVSRFADRDVVRDYLKARQTRGEADLVSRAEGARATAPIWYRGTVRKLGDRPVTFHRPQELGAYINGDQAVVFSRETDVPVLEVKAPGQIFFKSIPSFSDPFRIGYKVPRRFWLAKRKWMDFDLVTRTQFTYPAESQAEDLHLLHIVRNPAGGGLLLVQKYHSGTSVETGYVAFDSSGRVDPRILFARAAGPHSISHSARSTGVSPTEMVVSDGSVVHIVDLHDRIVRRFPESVNATDVESHVIERVNGLADYLIRYSLDGQIHLDLLRSSTGQMIPVRGLDPEGIRFSTNHRLAAQTDVGEITTITFWKDQNQWYAIFKPESASIETVVQASDFRSSNRSDPVAGPEGRITLEIVTQADGLLEWVTTMEVRGVPK
jgi:hypothetical protein